MQETLAILLPSAKSGGGGCTTLIIEVQLRKGSATGDFKEYSFQKFSFILSLFNGCIFLSVLFSYSK